jgi:hypothetical protein
MPWWLDGVLLLTALLLWFAGSAHPDDVWGLLQKMLAVIAVAVVLLGGRQMLLEAAVLAVALWLPGAQSRRLRSFNSAISGFEADRR